MLKATGVILGVFGDEEWKCEERLLSLEPNSRLWLVTDGVTEARSHTGVCFGMTRLERVVREIADVGLKERLEKLWASLLDYTGNRFSDDVTCVVMEFTR
jgi:serine phosphatase RsbU (regulator of sigma subunit)